MWGGGDLVPPVSFFFFCKFNSVSWIHLKVILGTSEPADRRENAEDGDAGESQKRGA